MIARRISKIVGADTGKCEFQIYDKQQDCMRDVEYRDIVILMRSMAKKANDYVQVLRLAGVPVSCEATAGYFEATEISDCLALLKVLDNPQRDIELAAVLRSPFFKITDTELAKIRIHNKTNEQDKNFYGSVLEYCNNGPDLKLAARLRDIIDIIERWRMLARRGSLADLIWQIYRQTGFLSFVSALPNGQARRANLLKLHDRAIQFEGFAGSAGNLSLTRFVEFIEKLQEVGQDWAPAEPDAAAGNAVRILSVHKSKGLEFPVVFLAELDSQFNKRDIYADFLADADDTLGLQIIDRKSNSKLCSLAHQVIAENKLSTTMAEEMRILYVATTRAKDRLILSACEKQKHCRDLVCNGFLSGLDPVPVWQLRRCKSPLEWILYGLSDQKTLHEAFKTDLAAAADDNLFSFMFYDQAQLIQLSEFVIGLKIRKPARPTGTKISRQIINNQLSIINESLSWRYAFSDAPVQPAKQSVTALTHHSDEFVKIDYSAALERQPKIVCVAEIEPPETIEARLIGTATHLVISTLDLARPVTKESIEEIKEKLVADSAISRAVAGHIDTKSILNFFQSDLGRMVLDTENNVSREWPFTFALPASELPDTLHETIIVQGIIDMLVKTQRGLLIIDFKTDKITAAQVPQRAEFYRTQLELYGRAASEILKQKLIAKFLYFLTPAKEFQIK
jgi:ATP-dependent helicase/nuclease subunit A